MLPKPFEKAKPILNKLEDAGYQAYFVGGAVRDLMLGRPTNDVDIATSALPEEVKAVFPKTIDVGIEHGTVVVLIDNTPYEITTFRSEEEYKDFRRPESVTFITSLKEDLQRRDFTMNAIALDSSGRFHDPFNGENDIKKCIIRTVGAAGERFNEDALRMMRAVRFVAQLNFKCEVETIESIKQNGNTLRYIAVERLTAEFEKLLSGEYKDASFKVLHDTGLYFHLPGLNTEGHVIDTLVSISVNHLTNEQMWILLAHLSEDSHGFLEKWRLPTKKIKYINKALSFLALRLKQEWSRHTLYQAGVSAAVDVETVYCVLSGCETDIKQLKKNYEELPIKNRGELAVTGNDLMAWTNKPGGPWIKEELEKTEKAVLDGRTANQKTAIREWLKLCNHQ